MAIVQCDQHHFYDNQRYSSCPICAKGVGVTVPVDDMRDGATSYLDDFDYPRPSNDAMTQGYSDYVGEDDHTIGIFTDEESQNQLTVGWLVCLKGPVKGKSYPFFSGRCFAGRGPDMDLVLSDDRHISRDKHFSLVYDPMSIGFFLVPGNGQTYLNGDPVSVATPLKEGDLISAGESEYCFIPYCKEGRVWA